MFILHNITASGKMFKHKEHKKINHLEVGHYIQYKKEIKKETHSES